MSAGGRDAQIQELAESIYELYERLGVPDHISFLDGRLSLSWGTAAESLDRYEEISMDAKLLYYLGGAAGCSSEIHFDINGYEFVVTSTGGEIRTRVYDMAKTREELE